MAQPTTNPTGYAVHQEPDFGPLFSSPVVPAPTPASSSEISNLKSQISDPAPLPKAVDTAARCATGRRQKILQYLVNNGPTTIHAFCSNQATPTLPNQVSGRFTDMAGEMLLEVIGEKPHPVSGCACQVYAITDRGRQELADLKSGTRKAARPSPAVSLKPQESR